MDCEECFGYGACHVCYGRAAINRLKKENEQLKTAVLKAANLLAGRKEQNYRKDYFREPCLNKEPLPTQAVTNTLFPPAVILTMQTVGI